MRKSLRKVIASLLAVALMVGTWSNGSVTAFATEEGANPVVETQGDENVPAAEEQGDVAVISDESEPSIVVTANSGTFEYNGKANSAGYTITVNGNVYSGSKEWDGKYHFDFDGEEYRFTESGVASFTGVGEYEVRPNEISVQKYVVKGFLGLESKWEDASVNVSYVPGTVTINKRPVTVQSRNITGVYDGKSKTKEIDVISGGFVDRYSVEYTNGSKVTDITDGNVENTFVIKFNDETKANNYDITYVYGTINICDATYSLDNYAFIGEKSYYFGEGTITGKILAPENYWSLELGGKTVVSKEDLKKYTTVSQYPNIDVNGVEYSYDPAENRANTYTVEWNEVKAVMACDAWLVGQADGKGAMHYHMNGSIKLQTENLYNVVFSVEKPGEGLVQVDNREKVQEGSALSAPAVDEVVEVNGTKYVFAGWYADAAFTIPADLTALTADTNYYGKYVAAQTLTLVPAVEAVTYDGKAHVVNSFVTTQFGDVTVSGLTVKAEGTDAGSYDVVVEGTAVVTDANGNDVTKFYNVDVESAKLVIAKKDATIASSSASKEYDGTPLKNDGFLLEGFVNNEVPTVVVTGSLTEIGTAANTFRVVYGEGIKENNYNVKLVEGTLAVTEIGGLVVTFNSDSKTYDGTALDGTFSANKELAPGHKFVMTGVSITNVGTEVNTATVKIEDANGKDVTSYYSGIQVVPGTLTVAPIDGLVVTFSNYAEEYDGQTHIGEYTFNMPLVEGHNFDINLPSIKDAGTQVNTAEIKIVDASENDVTANYNITVVPGTLTVTKREVILKTNSATKTYDGTALTNDEYGYFKPFLSGETPRLVFTGSQTDAGSSENTVEFVFPEGVNAKNYDITIVPGTLTVTKRVVKVVSNSDSKVYDGTALTNDGVTVTGTYANGETPEYVFSGTQTNAGSSDNAFTVVFPEGVKASNYDLTTEFGTLTVTKAAGPVVYMKNPTIVYGQNLPANVVDRIEGLVEGHELHVNIDRPKDTSAMPVGHYTNKLGTWGTWGKNVTVTCDGVDVTANYEKYSVVRGGYTVIPASAPEITFANAEARTYGDSLATDYSVNFAEEGYNERYVVEVTGMLTYVPAGSYEFKVADGQIVAVKDGQDAFAMDYIVYVAGDATKTDVKDNFAGVAVSGTWEVAKRNVTVESASDLKKYDATPLTNNKAIVVEGGFISGDEPAYNFTGTQTNVGTSDNKFTVQFKDTETEANYNVTTVFGTLEVTKANAVLIKFRHETVKVVYGQELPDNLYSVRNLMPGHRVENITLKLPANVSTLPVGTEGKLTTKDNGKMIVVDAEGNDVTANYEKIGRSEGNFVIVSAQSPTLTFVNNGRTYGDNLSADYAFDFVEEGYNERYVVEVTDMPTYVPAGSYTFSVSEDGKNILASREGKADLKLGYIIYAAGDDSKTDLKSNFGTVKVEGTWEVAKRYVAFGSSGTTRTYDGTPLTVSTIWTFGDGFVKGERPTFTMTGSQTDVGVSENTFTFEFGAGVDPDNYDLNYSFGTLTVTKRPVTVKSVNSERQYKLQPLTANEANVTSELGFVDGDVIGYNFTGSQDVPGSSANTFTVEFAEGKADNYDLTVEYGTLTVNPITGLEITFADVQKEYDGKPISMPFEKLVTVSPMLIGHEVVFEQSEVPTVVNVADSKDYKVSFKIMEGTKDVTAFYKDVKVNPGTFTVTKREGAVVTFADAEKVYDGTALIGEVSATGLADGQKLKLETVSIVDAGELPNTATFTVVDAAGKDVTANYADIEVKEGLLTVTKRNITLTSASDSKEYDGTALVNNGVTVEGEYVKGEEPSYNFSGTVTEVESVKNTFEVVFLAGVNADNYEIEKIYGDLEVVKRTGAVVTFADAEKIYDGTALVGEFTWNDKILDSHEVVVEKPVEITNKGDVTNVASFKVVDAEGNDVTEKYYDVIEVVEGTLKINPLAVTVKIVGTQVSVYYTGTEMEAKGYEATFSSDLYQASDFTFSGEAHVSATADGSYPYVMGLNADQFTNNNENFDVTFEVTDGYLKIYYLEGVSPAREDDTDTPVVNEPETQNPAPQNPVVQNPVVEEPEVETEEEEPVAEPEAEEVDQNTEADVVVEVVEDTTPAVSDNLVEIEDEDTPLANLDAKDGNGPIFWILLAGLMATVTLFIFFVILRRKKEEEDEELA